MRVYSCLVVGIAAFVATALANDPVCRVCKSDDCLKAIADNNPLGKKDCASYLMTIVDPATSAVTTTVTAGVSTSIVTVFVTEEQTPTTVSEELTTTLTPLLTDTISATTTTTAPARYFEQQQRRRDGHQARNDVSTTKSIPDYASACSGSMRYPSACSCIGIKASTTTLAMTRPTVTTTVTQTVPADVTTITISSTTTAEQHTTTEISTRTTTGATETVEETALATRTIVPSYCNFQLQFSSSSGKFAGQLLTPKYFTYPDENTPTDDTPITFEVNEGRLLGNGRTAYVSALSDSDSDGSSPVMLSRRSSTLVQIGCNVALGGDNGMEQLLCGPEEGRSEFITGTDYSDMLYLGVPGANPGSKQVVTLNMVPGATNCK